MGFYKTRLSTTITAYLRNWRLRGSTGVQGTIDRSIEKDYKDGDEYIFMNVTLTHYAYAKGLWPDHYLVCTGTGAYFYLLATEQM